MNEEEFKEEADLLAKLEAALALTEDQIRESKAKLLPYMLQHKIPKYPTAKYIILNTTNPRYKMPHPEQLRDYLGKENADKYIIEVVKKEVRLTLPPQAAEELCPVDEDSLTPFIKFTWRKNGENSK